MGEVRGALCERGQIKAVGDLYEWEIDPRVTVCWVVGVVLLAADPRVRRFHGVRRASPGLGDADHVVLEVALGLALTYSVAWDLRLDSLACSIA